LLAAAGCGGGGTPEAGAGGGAAPAAPAAGGDTKPAPAADKPKAAAKGGEAYTADKATGSIKGVVKLEGTAPVMAKMQVDADPKCVAHRADAKLGDMTKEDVVSKDGKLANVVVYVSKGAEKWSFDDLKLPNVTIDQNGCQYHPHVLALKTDQAIDIKSSDPLAHNIHGMPKESKEFNLAQAQAGVLDTHPKFSEPEMGVRIKCDVHSWMNAFACVFSHPFFAVTGEDGTFEIKLPPGDYEISAWQESSKLTPPEPVKVTVAADKPGAADLTFKVK